MSEIDVEAKEAIDVMFILPEKPDEEIPEEKETEAETGIPEAELPEEEEEEAVRFDPRTLDYGTIRLFIGETAKSYNWAEVQIHDMHAKNIGLADLDISSRSGAAKAMSKVYISNDYISDVRGHYGAMQNRLEHTLNSLGVSKENIQDAESVIRDMDVAVEMMKYTKASILSQAAGSMLAQANQTPQSALRLIRGAAA